jgi:hypothetical protein
LRRFALIPLLLIALVLAACGGGGSSSSGTSGNSAIPEEAAWAKEVRSVMGRFENNVSAGVVETMSTSSAQSLLEPLYRGYSAKLAQLAKELEATAAPEACVPVRKKIAADGRRVAELNKELGEQQDLSQEKYSLLVQRQGVKIGKYGREFTRLTAKPSC